MRILIISHEASLTGAPKVALKLAQYLENSGHDVYWIFQKGGILLTNLSDDSYSIWHPDNTNNSIIKKVRWHLAGGLDGYQNKIINKIKKWNPELIINNTVMNGAIIDEMKAIKVPVLSIVHEMGAVLKFAEYQNKSVTSTIKNSSHICAVSNAVKNDLLSNYDVNPENLTIIPGFSSLNNNNKETSKDHFTVGACGSLITRKGTDLFLQVAKKIQSNYPEEKVRFIWMGGIKGSLSYFEFAADIEKLGLSDVVELTGETEQPENYYQLFDVFFMCSREDPFPLVNLEATTFGAPILCFDQSGGSVEFANLGGGKVVPYCDINAAVEQIIHWKKNNPKLIEDSEKAKCTSEIFSSEMILPKWLSLIESMVNHDTVTHK